MISIIASYSKKSRAIGKNGKIPWEIPEEKLYFKSLTVGNAVIMGRKTFESIGKILPERMNIVISKNNFFEGKNLVTVKNLGEAIKSAENLGFEKIFIAGGENVYREVLPFAERLYLTEVYADVKNADAFFPEFNKEEFVLEAEEKIPGNPKYVKKIYRRIRNFV